MSEVIYDRIAMLRAERGISRRQLAEAFGVRYRTVGYLERGDYSPSLDLALRTSRCRRRSSSPSRRSPAWARPASGLLAQPVRCGTRL